MSTGSFPDGKILWIIAFQNGKRHGLDVSYDQLGRKIEEGQRAGGKKIGHWVYYRDGRKEYEGDYEDGKRHGTFSWYGPSGTVIKEVTYNRGFEE